MQKNSYRKQYFIICALLFGIILIFAIFVNNLFVKLILILTCFYGVYGFFYDYKAYFYYDEDKLVWQRRGKEIEIYWEKVKYIFDPNSLKFHLPQIRIQCSADKFLIITWWFRDYQDLVRYAIQKCKENEGIIIDEKLMRIYG